MKYFEIHPNKPIPNILPNHKRIESVTTLPLSRKEFLRCMNYATLYAVVGEDKLLVTEMDYDKALALFDKQVPSNTDVTIHLKDSVITNDKVVVQAQNTAKQLNNLSRTMAPKNNIPKSSDPVKVTVQNNQQPKQESSAPVKEEKINQNDPKTTSNEKVEVKTSLSSSDIKKNK